MLNSGFFSTRIVITRIAMCPPIPSGVYVYRLEARPTDGSAPFITLKKMLLLK
jgi:hypothetical protein